MPVREIVIQAHFIVAMHLRSVEGGAVIAGSGIGWPEVGQRKELRLRRQGLRAQGRRWKLVAGIRPIGEGILQRRGSRKIAQPLRQRGHVRGKRVGTHSARSIEHEIEKGPVPDDRPAARDPVVMQVLIGPRRQKRVARVECAVARVLKDGGMILIRARLRGGVDLADAAELRPVRQYVRGELLNGFERWLRHRIG